VKYEYTRIRINNSYIAALWFNMFRSSKTLHTL